VRHGPLAPTAGRLLLGGEHELISGLRLSRASARSISDRIPAFEQGPLRAPSTLSYATGVRVERTGSDDRDRREHGPDGMRMTARLGHRLACNRTSGAAGAQLSAS
jgi:hypothetical protein